MKKQLIVFQLIAILLSISGVFSGQIGVPVLLWQQKTDSQLFDIKSTINQIDGKVLADDYLTHSQTIVAFVQNRLSLEQFTTEDEERLTAVKSIFRDQSIKPTLLTDVLNPTQALTQKQFQRQEWDGIHVKNGDKIWVQLPEDSLAENNELLSELMSKIQKNVSKNALFLITGYQNQFQSIDLETPEVHKREVRAVESLQIVEEAPTENQEEYLIAVDNCLYFYTTSITLNNITGVYKELTQFNTSKADYTGSHCWTLQNKTSGENATNGLLQLKYKDINGTTDITLNLNIENTGVNYFWGLVDSKVSVKSTHFQEFKTEVEFELIDNEVESEQMFGYSCSQLTIASKAANDSEKLPMKISLTFSHFQLQPFVNPLNRKNGKDLIFTDTFDCEVWMTLPLWMGLLTLIVMFLILYMGVYFISIVNTPDRFENPKAKPLVITAIED